MGEQNPIEKHYRSLRNPTLTGTKILAQIHALPLSVTIQMSSNVFQFNMVTFDDMS